MIRHINWWLEIGSGTVWQPLCVCMYIIESASCLCSIALHSIILGCALGDVLLMWLRPRLGIILSKDQRFIARRAIGKPDTPSNTSNRNQTLEAVVDQCHIEMSSFRQSQRFLFPKRASSVNIQ